MKEIKTRETNNAPRILSDSARAPRELAKRSILEAKEKAKSVAQGESSQYSETPEQYASDKVEHIKKMLDEGSTVEKSSD